VTTYNYFPDRIIEAYCSYARVTAEDGSINALFLVFSLGRVNKEAVKKIFDAEDVYEMTGDTCPVLNRYFSKAREYRGKWSLVG
jgi:hypothetical protein